jgi:large subunit ribosomal protein L9
MVQIVLLERVEKLGRMGDVVNVRDGYARNFLLPKGKALRATKANLARFEAERAQIEARSAERKAEAEKVAASLDGKQFVVIRTASESGSLYGSVSPRDVAEAARAEGFEIDRTQVRLDKPVKELGLHAMSVQLHPEVIVTVTANVARTQEEAEIQAQGKSIAELRAEEEAAAEFEIAELFDDIGGAASEEDEEAPRARDGDDSPSAKEARGDDPRD